MLRVKGEGITHGADWIDIEENHGKSSCGFLFSTNILNTGPWPNALWRNNSKHWKPGWLRKINGAADVDCMACIAAEAQQ